MTTNPNIYESFIDTLDNTSTLPLYNSLFNKKSNVNLSNYIEDNYSSRDDNIAYVNISKKLNNTIIKKLLNNSINSNETEYNSISELNKEIEKEIANQNITLNVKNDKIINNLDKLRITDLANDYFFLQTLTLK